MGLQFPVQRTFKVEEGQAQGSPRVAQPGEVGWVPGRGPGSRRPAGPLASLSCCSLASGTGMGLWSLASPSLPQ